MAYIQPIYTFVILLSLISCNEILFSEGRQLKPIQDENESAAASQNNEGHRGNGYYPQAPPHATHAPIIDHSITGKKYTVDQSPGFDGIDAGHEDDFRPTMPGNSPGVGHAFALQKDEQP
ncbi:hypothetical protein CsSME_00005697 [Camellia sinensis var. sinensis]|uniref:Uncharacterized protein n=1 Tax=Camellia sinensis var. sinensis TaxID=542762 RepID=A0A4S4E4X4_CAMSN|nr:hypothetical protein TEA_005649 [Camellia sinensis var. sinensis]